MQDEDDLPFNPVAPDLSWRSFCKQAAALEYADSLPSERQAQVWSLELDQGKGKRSYIVRQVRFKPTRPQPCRT